MLAVGAALALLQAPITGAASEALEPELTMTAGTAVINAAGSTLLALRYGNSWGVHAGLWLDTRQLAGTSPRRFVGVDHRWRWRDVQFGLGAVLIDKVNDVNGTRANFDLTLSYRLSNRVLLELRHFSHGKILGIRTGVRNKGWNFASVGIRF